MCCPGPASARPISSAWSSRPPRRSSPRPTPASSPSSAPTRRSERAWICPSASVAPHSKWGARNLRTLRARGGRVRGVQRTCLACVLGRVEWHAKRRGRVRAQHTRTPLHPAALASVPYGVVLVRVLARCGCGCAVARSITPHTPPSQSPHPHPPPPLRTGSVSESSNANASLDLN